MSDRNIVEEVYVQALLVDLLELHVLDSCYDQYETTLRRELVQTYQNKGEAAGNTALAQMDATYRFQDFSDVPKIVATGFNNAGLLQRLRLVKISKDLAFPHEPTYNGGRMVVLPSLAVSGASRLKLWRNFGPRGFDIRALALLVSPNSVMAEVAVIMPARQQVANYSAEQRSCGFSVVKIQLTGHTSAINVLPHTPVANFLPKCLGLQTGAMTERSVIKDHFDRVVGLQNAREILSANLVGGLADYLRRLSSLIQ